MNLSKKLTLTIAIENLQALLTLVDNYDLARALKNGLIEERLKQLEDQVAQYFSEVTPPTKRLLSLFQIMTCIITVYNNYTIIHLSM